MRDTVLTSEQAKQARAALDIPQGKVASALNISRSYLSQFENGRLNLSDTDLEMLREFYEEHGFAFDNSSYAENASANESAFKPAGAGESHAPNIVNGIFIPPRVSEQEACAALTEYAENRQKLLELCSQPLKQFFLFGVDEEDRDRKAIEVLSLMARNFVVVETLLNKDPLSAYRQAQHETIGRHITQLLAALHLGSVEAGELA